MVANWLVMAPMIVTALLVGMAMVFLTGRADRTVRRAQHLRDETLHEELL